MCAHADICVCVYRHRPYGFRQYQCAAKDLKLRVVSNPSCLSVDLSASAVRRAVVHEEWRTMEELSGAAQSRGVTTSVGTATLAATGRPWKRLDPFAKATKSRSRTFRKPHTTLTDPFWTCASTKAADRCKCFKWADEADADPTTANPRHAPAAKWQQFASKRCEKRVVHKVVKKKGHNRGQTFYKCGWCKYYEFVTAAPVRRP